MTATDINHGTATAYNRHGCRCAECVEARREYMREYRAGLAEPVVGRLLEPRPFWFQFASCRPEYADRPLDQWVAMFFPTRGADLGPARDICAECPAKDACADHGLAEKYGVWGGTSEKERRRLRRKLATHTSPAA